MKRLTCMLAVWFLAGCAHTRELEVAPPELIRISSLPSISSFTQNERLTINVLFRVLVDGEVAEVRILGTSGDPAWDAAAKDSMRGWRFHRIAGCPPEGTWIRNALVVQAEEQRFMSLGELVMTGEREADSLHALLESGVAFESLARMHTATSEPYTALTDIARFPRKVRDVLRKLRVDEFTRPIRVGGNYVIYKRFRLDNQPKL